LRSSSRFLEYIFLQTFCQTPSVQTIFVSVNKFNFLTLVLSSSILSMTMYPPRTHLWYVILHCLHYHLVIWDHLLLVQVVFPALFESVTIWSSADSLFSTTLNFKINSVGTLLCHTSILIYLL
jgi:hypothetical protein